MMFDLSALDETPDLNKVTIGDLKVLKELLPAITDIKGDRMTKQIVIKLNRKRYEPLFKDLMECTGTYCDCATPSECTAKLLFMMYFFCNKKMPKSNKSIMQVMMDGHNMMTGSSMAYEDFFIYFNRLFNHWKKSGEIDMVTNGDKK